jgi:hypothetical protein
VRKVKPRFERIPVAVVKKMIEEEARKKKETANSASSLKTRKKDSLVGPGYRQFPPRAKCRSVLFGLRMGKVRENHAPTS